jgi:hypothetical protein
MAAGYVQGGVRDCRTKKELKQKVATDASQVYFFSTAGVPGMDPGYNGVIGSMPSDGTKLTVVGPDPYRDRRWYATIERKADGTIKVS